MIVDTDLPPGEAGMTLNRVNSPGESCLWALFILSHPPRTPSFPPSTSFSHCHSFFYFINRFLICHYIYTHLPALQNTLKMEIKIIISDSLSHSRSKSSVVILQAFLFSSCLFKFIFHWRVIALCCAGVYHTTT